MPNHQLTPPLTIDVTNAMIPGPAGCFGIASPLLISPMRVKLSKAMAVAFQARETGEIAWAELASERSSVDLCIEYANVIKKKFRNFVQFGIGGSALGAQALLDAVCHPFANNLPGNVRIFVADNIDPDWLHGLFEIIDPKETAFHVVTKSGATPETMAQAFLAIEQVKQAVGDNWRDHLYITTDPRKGALKKWAVQENLPTLHIHPNVGGRFSVLTSVGLLAAAVAGVDVYALLDGAQWAEEKCWRENPEENPAAKLAALLYRADVENQIKMFVMMPYSSRLYRLGDWFRQLWAESVGKRLDLNGNEVFVGTTPIKALGATDQHSQVQLYVEGPKDKLTIFVEAPFNHEVTIPQGLPGDDSLSYLTGHTFNELIHSELRATERALAKAERPSICFALNGHTPEAIGAFFYLWEVTTAFAGYLYNINPFDQPGVETGKVTTAALLGKKGMEAEANAIRSERDAYPRILL
ncbi:MAG: glucose-6-phosphate isomerase [bacterium]|nr:glucose-6-phosphate isomerase [bacterium]